jgi:glutamine synthetase
LDSEKALDNDLANWSKINEIRKYIAKDSTHYNCLFTRIKDAIKEEKYKEASDLSVELENKIEKLRKMYHDYTKNILDL